MTTALFSHPDCLRHVTPSGHPEQVARLEVINRAFAAPDFDAILRREAPLGTEEMVRLAHPKVHFERIRDAEPTDGKAQLDPDTYMSPGSFNAALHGVGGIVAAVDAVLDGEASNAFVACRPPGHHAEKAKPMGFCLFSTVAIGALHALENRGLERVAVVDFDVHHGNGTQDVLWHESRIRFGSTHQYPLYPGTGAPNERGVYEQILNLSLSAGTGSTEMRAAWEGKILPWIEELSPDLLLVSAGFDAHKDDPLAQLEWETEDYGWLTAKLCDVADRCCEGRLVSTLEGGYDLNALEQSATLHLKTLMERGR